MTLVRILRNYPYPDLLRQTPGGNGYWDDIHFVLDELGSCDYAIILNGVNEPATLECSPRQVWALMQEPPTEFKKKVHEGNSAYFRVFTQDNDLKGLRYVLSQPALPWHVNKSYDELSNQGIPEKHRNLSWVTSNQTNLNGHKRRMKFLNLLQDKVDFDLYGRGFNYVQDKWDGIASYKYSLAIENFQNDYYWSEKIADCFLSWTMPIYFGCTKITDYFPAEAIIQLDNIDSPDVVKEIQEISRSDHWEKNVEAIEYARNLVLNQYQLFPFLAEKICNWENSNKTSEAIVEQVIIPALPKPKQSLTIRIKRYLKDRLPKLVNSQKR